MNEQGSIDARIIDFANDMITDKEKIYGMSNWLRDQEPILVEWALKFGMTQVGAIMSEYMSSLNGPIPGGLAEQFRKAITSAVGIGFMIATLGFNDEFDHSIITNPTHKNAGAAYDKWMKGLMDSEYYNADSNVLERIGITSKELGNDWLTAVENHGKITENQNEKDAQRKMRKELNLIEEKIEL